MGDLRKIAPQEEITTYVVSTRTDSGYMQVTKFVNGHKVDMATTSMPDGDATIGDFSAEIARTLQRGGRAVELHANSIAPNTNVQIIATSNIGDPSLSGLDSSALTTAAGQKRTHGFTGRFERPHELGRGDLPFALGDGPGLVEGGTTPIQGRSVPVHAM